MPPRVWPHLIIAVLAAILVGLGLLSHDDPYLQGVSTIYDGERRCWSVSGEVVYPSIGTLNFPGGKAKLMERIVPFSLTIPDASARNSIGSNVHQLATAATEGRPGRRNINVPALEGGWLVC